MGDYIKKGDKVHIYWEHAQPEFNATVMCTPTAEGQNYWDLKREDGTPLVVYNFAKMELVR
jgi:hypothetical protein